MNYELILSILSIILALFLIAKINMENKIVEVILLGIGIFLGVIGSSLFVHQLIEMFK